MITACWALFVVSVVIVNGSLHKTGRLKKMRCKKEKIIKLLRKNVFVWAGIFSVSILVINENSILGIGITTALILSEMARQTFNAIHNDLKTSLYIMNKEIEKYQKYRDMYAERLSEIIKPMQ